MFFSSPFWSRFSSKFSNAIYNAYIPIKNDTIKQPKIPIEQKIEKIEENKIEPKNIIPQIPKNLFCILHNQNQIPLPAPKFNTPHLKKKRFIDENLL